ncbi:MAG TPA: DUF4214 domain-containing protein [Actinotalea sp.]|nr:DUF4214 domain-containing protein [Actinotalea sp.]
MRRRGARARRTAALALGALIAGSAAAPGVATPAAATPAAAVAPSSAPAAPSRVLPAAPPYYPVGRYVAAVYQDLFGRSPDPAGLAHWSYLLARGTAYSAVADSITGSDELCPGLVRTAYRRYLGRSPEPAGLASWLAAMRAGMHVQQMESGFLASPEYYTRAGGTPAGWVAALYRDVLGRGAGQQEVASWVAVLPARGREAVARGFLYSTEKLTADLDALYRSLLRRGLDPVGTAGWVRALQGGVRVEVVVAGIIASNEYRSRVPVTTPPAPGQPYHTGALAPLGFRPFPATDAWNTRVDTAEVDPASATLIASIGASRRLHMDFGANWDGGPFGIPYVVVGAGHPRYPITFGYASESDPGPYPIPPDAPIEGGTSASGDRHVIVVDASTRTLYELFDAHPRQDGSWYAGSGAVFDLTNGTTRPARWTSADAAGLPILPGLVRYEEVAAGRIDHALRFTVSQTRRAYVAPARHFASSNRSASLPPMGMRVRLKADFDISGYPQQARVILQAMKTYGMIVADNGSDWYVSGTADARWDDNQLNTLKNVPGSAFEVVRMGPVTTG